MTDRPAARRGRPAAIGVVLLVAMLAGVPVRGQAQFAPTESPIAKSAEASRSGVSEPPADSGGSGPAIGPDRFLRGPAERRPDPFYRATDSLLLHRIYRSSNGLVDGWTGAAHVSAYPVFWGAVPAAAIGTELAGGSVWDAPFELALAEGGAYLLQAGLKLVIERPRPYLRYERIDSRSRRLGTEDPDFSMPSGHATGAFALSTSWYLSHRHWELAVPLGLWAGGVALSRPRLGVHYPSDVLLGAMLGIAIGVAAHHAGPHLAP